MDDQTMAVLLKGKTDRSLELYYHFVKQVSAIGPVSLYPTKTMIGLMPQKSIETLGKKEAPKCIAWVTQFGKAFIHVVFPFTKPHQDNLCFTKIAQVPGDDRQYNHHFRMHNEEDVNEEVMEFIRRAFKEA